MMRATFVLATTIAVCGCANAPTGPSRLDQVGSSTSTDGQNTLTTQSRIDPSLGHGGADVSATLSGAAEVPGPGDPDGSGTARITLNAGQGEVCFALEVDNIAPAFASHIHVGGPTVAGPVVVTLAPPPTSGSSTACVSADGELVKDILKDPSGYYVNVHNADFPAGAIRGQLAR